MIDVQFDFDEVFEFKRRIGSMKTFNNRVENATEEIAQVLYDMLYQNTPVKTGYLRSSWDMIDNIAFNIKQESNGFSIELTNNVEYAYAVNYGHYSYNQYGGPYEVKNRTVKWRRGGRGKTFVYGNFFVEKSVALASNQLKPIIMKELSRWFRWCANGK